MLKENCYITELVSREDLVGISTHAQEKHAWGSIDDINNNNNNISVLRLVIVQFASFLIISNRSENPKRSKDYCIGVHESEPIVLGVEFLN